MEIRLSQRWPTQRTRVLRFIRFSLVGLTGIAVNEGALALLVAGLGLHYVVGYLLATQFSTLWNFTFFETWALKSPTYRNRRWQRLGMILLVNNVANVASVPILVLFTSVLGIHYLISNILTLGIVIAVRFTIADWIWSPGTRQTLAEQQTS